MFEALEAACAELYPDLQLFVDGPAGSLMFFWLGGISSS